VFDLNAKGRAGIIEPVSLTEMLFEENDLLPDPYIYHVTHFAFSDWEAALLGDDEGPTEAQVTSGIGPFPCDEDDPDCPYGFLDADGQIVLPFFGLSDAGIKVQRKPYNIDGPHHLVDLHKRGLDNVDISFIRVRRPMAADTVDLGFKVDYFPPSMTTAIDGSDGSSLGRGIFLGFGFNEAVAEDPILENQISLGALPVGAGVLMRPDEILSDFGPAAALRLWGNTLDAGTLEQTGHDMLENILSSERLTGHWQDTYDRLLEAVDVADIGATPPDVLADFLLNEGLIGEFALDDVLLPHPDFEVFYNVGDLVGEDPSPETIARRVAGYLDFASPGTVVGDLSSEIPELARVEADIVSLDEFDNEFFAFARSQLDVRRHVREAAGAGQQSIMELGRNALPGGMKLPGAQDIDFPDLPGVSWEFDYDVAPPDFTFKSLTGSLDLTEGGLSGLGFNELGATLKFYAGGDWFFEANADIDFNQVAAEGDILLGSTKTLDPLRSLAPDVADFLGAKDAFDGAFLRVGMRRNWLNFGCPLLVSTRVRVGGWFYSDGDTYGGLVAGRLTGDGACLLAVSGNQAMTGGMERGVFTLRGDLWVAGGVGWDCDEGSWDRPGDVLGDGGCMACVVDTGCEFTYPDKELDCIYPRYRCR
jgi:hypothetical protein